MLLDLLFTHDNLSNEKVVERKKTQKPKALMGLGKYLKFFSFLFSGKLY
jgi:hypothetical protein